MSNASELRVAEISGEDHMHCWWKVKEMAVLRRGLSHPCDSSVVSLEADFQCRVVNCKMTWQPHTQCGVM